MRQRRVLRALTRKVINVWLLIIIVVMISLACVFSGPAVSKKQKTRPPPAWLCDPGGDCADVLKANELVSSYQIQCRLAALRDSRLLVDQALLFIRFVANKGVQAITLPDDLLEYSLVETLSNAYGLHDRCARLMNLTVPDCQTLASELTGRGFKTFVNPRFAVLYVAWGDATPPVPAIVKRTSGLP